MICPICSQGEISPVTRRCSTCGFMPTGAAMLEVVHAETVEDLARRELAARFHLDVCLGQGAASVVYLARELGLSRHIVVKALARPAEATAEMDDKFARAVEAVAALDHPHIVPVLSHGSTEHLYWYSMEHVRGRSLREVLSSSEHLELKACRRIITQVAGALDHLHRQGIVHGAVKPENVLIDAEGWVHVGDPFVTLALKPPARPAGAMDAGAPWAEVAQPLARSPYAAPEGLHTPFSDQYALAVLVHECLAGSAPPGPDRPGVAPTLALAKQRPDLPPQMMYATRRALSPKPVERFPGVLDFVAALEAPSVTLPDARPSGQTAGAVLLQPEWEPPARPVRSKLVYAAASVVGVAVVGVVALSLVPGGALRDVLSRRSQAPFVSLVTDTFARRAPTPDTALLSALNTRPQPVGASRSRLPPARAPGGQGPVAPTTSERDLRLANATARGPLAQLRVPVPATIRTAIPPPSPSADPRQLAGMALGSANPLGRDTGTGSVVVVATSVYSAAMVEEAPRRIGGPAPRYPAILRQAGIGGQVTVECVVDTAGRVEPGSIRTVSSSNPLLEQAAREAVAAWTFRPGRLSGQAVRVRVQLPLTFQPVRSNQ